MGAATKLIVAHGFEAVTFQDVLDAADITKGKFFHYFKNKEELFRTILLDALSSNRIFDFAEVLKPYGELSGYNRLKLLLGRLIDWHKRGLPAEMRLCVMAAIFFPPDSIEIQSVRKLLGSNLKVVGSLVEAAQMEGDLPKVFSANAVACLLPSSTIGGNIIEFLSNDYSLPAKNLETLEKLIECAHLAVKAG